MLQVVGHHNFADINVFILIIILCCFYIITFRTMHYPPESQNIMLLCRLLATIELSPSPQNANKTVSNVNKYLFHNNVYL